jgi:hypothetical protein
MSMNQPPKPAVNLPPERKRGSGLLLILLGCGGVMFVGLLVCGGLIFVGTRWGMQQVNEFAQPFENQGYVRQSGQVIQVNQPVTEDTLYVCQVLTITADVDADIAAACQVLEIKANIHGDVDFFGQVLKQHPGSVIDGDLRVKAAQSVELDGEVKGKVIRNYGGPGEPPPPTEEVVSEVASGKSTTPEATSGEATTAETSGGKAISGEVVPKSN